MEEKQSEIKKCLAQYAKWEKEEKQNGGVYGFLISGRRQYQQVLTYTW